MKVIGFFFFTAFIATQCMATQPQAKPEIKIVLSCDQQAITELIVDAAEIPAKEIKSQGYSAYVNHDLFILQNSAVALPLGKIEANKCDVSSNLQTLGLNIDPSIQMSIDFVFEGPCFNVTVGKVWGRAKVSTIKIQSSNGGPSLYLKYASTYTFDNSVCEGSH